MRWKCPECGSHNLREICSSEWVESGINSISEEGEIVYGNPELVGDIHIEGYICCGCEKFVNCNGQMTRESSEFAVDTPEELAEFIKEHCDGV